MPKTEVVLFSDDDGTAPLLQWLDEQHKKVQDKCFVRIERLAECGHELRRPEADLLRDGVHELRIHHMDVNYRVLYFFHGQRVVLSHGLKKEAAVPDKEIDLAINRYIEFKKDPRKHTYSNEE